MVESGSQFKSAEERNSCRLFVGNLTDAASKEQVEDVFGKHGKVLQISFHKGYGFIQYDSKDAVQRAIDNEKGTEIGGRKIDPQQASKPSRGPGGGGGRRRGDDRDDRRYGDDRDDRRYRRDRSPGRGRDYGGPHGEPSHHGGRRYYDRGGPPPRGPPPPLDGYVVKIILLGVNEREFAEDAAYALRQEGISHKIEMLDGRGLGKALGDAEDNYTRYALIIGSANARKGLLSLKLLAVQRGRCPTYDVSIPELINIVLREEDELGVRRTAPPPPPPDYQSHIDGRYNNHLSRNPTHPLDRYGPSHDSPYPSSYPPAPPHRRPSDDYPPPQRAAYSPPRQQHRYPPPPDTMRSATGQQDPPTNGDMAIKPKSPKVSLSLDEMNSLKSLLTKK